MVNLVRIGSAASLDDDADLQAARAQVALALQAQQQAGPSQLPIAQGGNQVQAKYGIGNALADLANKFTAVYAANRATQKYKSLQDQQNNAIDADNQAKIADLAPDRPASQTPVSIGLDAVPSPQQGFSAPDLSQTPSGPTPAQVPQPQDQPVTMGESLASPMQANPARQQIADAMSGMNRGDASDFLSKALLAQAMPKPAQPFTLDKGAVRFDGQGNQTAANVQPQEPKSLQHTDSGLVFDPGSGQYRDSNGTVLTTDQIAARERALAAAKAASKPGAEPLSADTIANAGWDLLTDPNRIRQYASFGQSGQDIRNQVNNAKTKLMAQAGMTEPEALRAQAESKANIKSVGELVPMRNAISAYETVARGNGDRFLQLANKVNTSGIPLLNSAERLGKLATGDPDAAEMMQVLQNYQTETARIIANPRLVGQLTDTARKEIENVIPANVTPQQGARIINRLNFEFELRGRGLDDSIAKAQSGIVPGNTGPAPNTTPMTQAPQGALDYLKANPAQAPAFKAKYGYLPSG